MPDQRAILVVTPTYDRPHRMRLLERCVAAFRPVPGLFWIVVEDAADTHPEVDRLLTESGIRHVYLATGPTRSWGNAQRNVGLTLIRDHGLEGVVYLADDDNLYQPPLFAELRKVRRVGVMPVGLLGPTGVERPIVRKGRITGWSAHWTSRRFPVDMAAFAFDARLLHGLDGELWAYRARGGETEFLERLLTGPEDLELLCDDCRACYAWHDLPLGGWPSIERARYLARRQKLPQVVRRTLSLLTRFLPGSRPPSP